MTEVLEAQLKAVISDHFPIKRVSQGAEAIVFRTNVHPYLNSLLTSQPDRLESTVLPTLPESSYIIKYRPPKSYRHPTLDKALTKHRTLSEARLLQKLAILGVNVPAIIHVDFRQGIIWMEDITGASPSAEEDADVKAEMRGSLKNWIWDYEKKHGEDSIGIDSNRQSQNYIKALLYRVGEEIGKLHMADTVHGDLTTSNILLRPLRKSTPNGDGLETSPKKQKNEDTSLLDLEPVLIDFGLGSYSTLAEDKAVDLYVLERAVGSTHPVNSTIYNTWLLDGYTSYCSSDKKGSGPAKIKDVIKKLQDVRLRGRKRSMVG